MWNCGICKNHEINYTSKFSVVCMYVCTYVHTYVCMYVCMHACMHVCMYVCMYVCAYVRMYICMYIYTYVCTYVCIQWVFTARPNFCRASISLPSSNICKVILLPNYISSRVMACEVDWIIIAMDSVIRGYHVYKYVWVSYIGEVMQCRCNVHSYQANPLAF